MVDLITMSSSGCINCDPQSIRNEWNCVPLFELTESFNNEHNNLCNHCIDIINAVLKKHSLMQLCVSIERNVEVDIHRYLLQRRQLALGHPIITRDSCPRCGSYELAQWMDKEHPKHCCVCGKDDIQERQPFINPPPLKIDNLSTYLKNELLLNTEELKESKSLTDIRIFGAENTSSIITSVPKSCPPSPKRKAVQFIKQPTFLKLKSILVRS